MFRRVVAVPTLIAALLLVAAVEAAGPGYTPLPAPNLQLTFADPAFTALPGARAFFGKYDGGTYRIEVPGNWNGTVFLYDHGYQGASSPNAPFPGTASSLPSGTASSLREHLISKGYAWASTSYRSTRWIPGLAAQDTVLLRDLFIKLVGSTPRRTFLYGTSMGGNVVAIAMEQFAELYDGAVTECGVTAGIDLIDYFMSYGFVAEYLTGADMASLAPQQYLDTRIVPALGQPGQLTAKGKQFQSIILNLTGGRRPFDTEGFALSYSFFVVAVLQDLNNDAPVLSSRVTPLVAAAGNTGVVYHVDAGLGLSDSALNAGVRRKLADPSLRGAGGPYVDLRPVTGEIKRPVLSIHTTGDYTVPITVAQAYRRAVDKAGSGNLLVQRAIRNAGHCTFSVPEQSQAVDDLVRWVEFGVKPEGDNLLGDLTDIGKKFTNPIRPGDPGHAADPPAPAPAAAAAPVPAVRPPSTGDAGLLPAESRQPAILLPLLVAAVSALFTSCLATSLARASSEKRPVKR